MSCLIVRTCFALGPLIIEDITFRERDEDNEKLLSSGVPIIKVPSNPAPVTGDNCLDEPASRSLGSAEKTDIYDPSKCKAIDQMNKDRNSTFEYDYHVDIEGEKLDRSFDESPVGLIDDSQLLLATPKMLTRSVPTVEAKASSLHDMFAEMDSGPEQPSLEYEETWKSEMYEVKSPEHLSRKESRKHKIVIRDLSFDDNGPFSELAGIDLLCPVFLAVTEDEEDDDFVLKDIRRKAKSIENLCSTLDDEQGINFCRNNYMLTWCLDFLKYI